MKHSLNEVPAERSYWHIAGYVALGVYLLAGIIYSLCLSSELRYLDEEWMLTISRHIRSGIGFSRDGINLTAGRPPGYAYFLVICESLGANVHGIRIVHFLLLTATIWLCWRYFLPEFQNTGLLLMTVLVGFYPILTYLAGTLYPQTLSAFLFIAALGLMLKPERGFLATIGGGLSYGLLILTAPTFGLTLLVLLGVGKLLKLFGWREVFLIFVAAGMMVGAWTIRNYMVFQQFIPVAANSGYNLLAGNSPVAKSDTGSTDELVNYISTHVPAGLSEIEQDRYYQKLAVDWVRSHPRDAFVLYLEKSLNYFNLWNKYWTNQVSSTKENVQALCYGVLLALLIWRLLELRRFPMTRVEILLLMIYILTAFTQAIFFTRIRHRAPYDFLILILIARFIENRFLCFSPKKSETDFRS